MAPLLTLVFALLTLAHPCSPLLTPVFSEEPQVRVAILQEVTGFRLTALESCRARDLKTSAVLAEWPKLLWQEVKSDGSALKIGSAKVASTAVLIEVDGESIFRINARPYRGRLILYVLPDGKMTAVNQLDLEKYLVGAVASEAHSDWPPEALKAHAVVSRTLVAHRIWIRRQERFDVTADTSTHLYYGVAAERETIRRAVEETQGQVLAYQRELLSATFHANCGGHTEDAAEIWSVKAEILPLKGVPDPYCKDRRHFRWKAQLRNDEFMKRLGPEADPIGDFVGAEVVERNRSGRARAVVLRGSRGEVRLTGRRFRERLGANRLRSLKFDAVVSKGRVTLSGLGWGHGVGFCQWGAYGMARQGKKAAEILAFYFPGTQVRGLRGLPGFDR